MIDSTNNSIKSKILAVGGYLPKKELSNSDFI